MARFSAGGVTAGQAAASSTSATTPACEREERRALPGARERDPGRRRDGDTCGRAGSSSRTSRWWIAWSQLTEVARGFEALQRGLTILMNDVDGRAITELGRR